MATLDYVNIPPGAVRLQKYNKSSRSSTDSRSLRKEPEIKINLPRSSNHLNDTRNIRPASTSSSQLSSPTKTAFNALPQILFASTIPGTPGSSSNVRRRSTSGNQNLLSKRDPLSLPITTVNFRRFVARVGPIFWMQDRIEEVVFWRRGWQVTCTWMAAYGFLCYFPRLVFLLPHLILLGILLATHPSTPRRYSSTHVKPPPFPNVSDGKLPHTHNSMQNDSHDHPPVTPVPEESIDWQANMQGIQNLMGSVSDVYDAAIPLLPYLTYRTPYSRHILNLTFLSMFPILVIVTLPQFPIQLTALLVGWGPLLLTHPKVMPILPTLFTHAIHYSILTIKRSRIAVTTSKLYLARKIQKCGIKIRPVSSPLDVSADGQVDRSTENGVTQAKKLYMAFIRTLDNDNLTDEAWNSELQEVELYENERWGGRIPASVIMSDDELKRLGEDKVGDVFGSSDSSTLGMAGKDGIGWSKNSLKPSERKAWTRGRDGWSGVGADGTVSNLTFSLASGWRFVETEDWRVDIVGDWIDGLVDASGWTYTNDAWLDPRPYPYAHSVEAGLTRRRRWVRRIWYKGA